MFYKIIKYWKTHLPAIKGKIFKIIYQNKSLRVGSNFQCDSIPDINITHNGKLAIGDNVIFRRNVEIRVHNDSQIQIGNNIRIDRGVRLLAANKALIKIADGTRIGLYSIFSGGDSITVGKECLISGFVYLQTSMHRYKGEENIQKQGFDHAPLIIENDVWIGAHAVILPGVTLGAGAIVGSNAVVNKSAEPGWIVGGVPAKLIKSRTEIKK